MALVEEPYVKQITGEELERLIAKVDVAQVETSQQKLWKPKGQTLYVYVVDTIKDPEDWRADGYRWKQNGTSFQPSKNPTFRKTHFFVQSPNTPNKVCTAFKRYVIRPLSHPNLVFVQYIGRESAAVDFPHGNSKRTFKNFIPTAPSLKKSLASPEASYRMLEEKSEAEPENHQPRNRDQVKYFKNRDNITKQNLNCKDHVLALNEIAYAAFGLIWHLTTFPDIIVVFGLPDLLEFATCQPGRLILSYDIVLSLPNFTLSCVSVETSLFPDKRVPIAFCLHEGSFKNVHDIFFSELYTRLNCLRGVVITITLDNSVAAAIKKCCPEWYPVTYWNSIYENVDSWCKGHITSKTEAQRYRANIRDILISPSDEVLQVHLVAIMPTWSAAFAQHYEQQLKSAVIHSYTCYLNHIGVLADNVASSPSLESLKSVLARFQDIKDLSSDRLVFSIYKLQLYYHSHIKSNSMNFGAYTRQSDIAGKLTSNTTTDIDNLMTEIRQRLRDRTMEAVPTVTSAIAEEMTITHIPAQKSFLVGLPSGPTHVVKLYPRETCSCSSNTVCAHILAVTNSLGRETEVRPCIILGSVLAKSRPQSSKKQTKAKRCKTEKSEIEEDVDLVNSLVNAYDNTSASTCNQALQLIGLNTTSVQDHNGYTVTTLQVQ